jgi:hypothetical protein
VVGVLSASRPFIPALLAAVACGPSAGGPATGEETGTEPGTSTGPPSAGSTSSGETAFSSSTSESSVSDDSTTSDATTADGAECPAADLDMPPAGAGVGVADYWPESGPMTATCEAISLVAEPRGYLVLTLECAHRRGGTRELRIRLHPDIVDGQLDDMPGTTGLEVSFNVPEEGSIGCSVCGDVVVRDAAGDLVLLGNRTDLYDGIIGERVGLDVGGPEWFPPGSPEHATWSAPFTDLFVRNLGCAPREAIDPGSDTEIPLALQFTSDAGLVSIYDKNSLLGVEVGGQTFDVFVSDAFSRGPLTCGDCAATETTFLILRSSR